MLQIGHLISLAGSYAAALHVEEKTVSHRVFADSKKLASIRAGGDITVTRFNGALMWFSVNWPENVAWPEDIKRPLPPALSDEMMLRRDAPEAAE